jgi:tRNA G10  N-methylase Trm11
MEYKYTPPGENYTAYAAGGVFYAAPGHTAFPVRLAVEVFRRCLALRAAAGATGPAVVYDPCCGSAYHLATMAYFTWEQIAAIYASDIDEDALGIARRNLSLLTVAGMDRRIAQVADLHQQYGKPSHAEALEHARMLRERLIALSGSNLLPTHLFRADATGAAGMATGLKDIAIDVVLTDVPYGLGSTWRAGDHPHLQGGALIQQMLAALLPHLAPHAVVAVAAAKKDHVADTRYRRVERLSIGQRQVVILRPQPSKTGGMP